jgi:hypothetical protein
MKLFRTFGKIRLALVRTIILLRIRRTIRIPVSTRRGNLLSATLSVTNLVLIQNSIQLVMRNLSLRMKSWNLKLTAHILLVQKLKCVELEIHFQMRVYDLFFLINLQGLCVNLSVETFVQFPPIGMDFMFISYK